MKGLKQTLTKVEPRKGAKNMTTTAANMSKKSTWKQLHSLIQCRSPNKFALETKAEQQILSIIEEAYKLNNLVNFQRTLEEVKAKIQQAAIKSGNFDTEGFSSNHEITQCEQLQETIHDILGRLKKDSKQSTKDSLTKFDSLLSRYIIKQHKIERREKVEEFDRLIRMLSPRHFGNKVQRRKQVSNARSPRNLKVKVTREEYEVMKNQSQHSSPHSAQNSHNESRRAMKSASIDQGRSKNLSVAKSDDGFNRLKKLMSKSKEGSYKVIKTKIQYDYSAIFEASKTRVKPRNTKNQTQGPLKNENSMTSKLNKVRKNDAFVFYRPQAQVGIKMGKPKKQKERGKNKGMSLHGFIADQ